MRLLVRYIFVALVSIPGLVVKAQINPETAFYWENPYYINPASVNLDYRSFFSVNARKQWMSLEGSPTTFWGTGTLYMEDHHTQAGVKILNDRIGYVNTLDVSLSYAYVLRLTWNSFLNMGISGSYQSQNYDRNKVTIENPDDPIFSNIRFQGLTNWNVGLGVEYVYDKSLTIGISGQNIMSFFKDEQHIFGGTNYAYGRYRTRSLGRGFDAGKYRTQSFPRSYDMEYGICLKQYAKDFQVDGMISLYINRNTQEEKFQFSLFGRTVGEVGVLAGMKLVSELKFLFAYDYNFGGVGTNAYGSFEVMVSYPIHKNPTCRSQWDR